MPQPSAEILHALTTSLSAAFTKGLAGVTPQYLRIATEVPSSSASNTYGWLSDLPEIKEWIGERQLAVLSQQGYTVTNRTWESSIRVKRETIEDDQLGQFSIIAVKSAFSRIRWHLNCYLKASVLFALMVSISLIPTIRWREALTATSWATLRLIPASRGF